MKNKLFFNFAKSLFRKMSFRMAALAVLTLLSVQSSFAQTTTDWVGGTSSDFYGANWSVLATPATPATPDFNAASNFNILPGVTYNPVLNSAYPATNNTCGVINVRTGATLTTNANITTSTATNTIDGTLNINAGIFKSRLYIGNSGGSGGLVNVAAGATLNGVGVNRIGLGVIGNHNLNVNGTYIMSAGSSLELGSVPSASTGRKGTLTINSGGLAQILGTLTVNANGTVLTGTVNVAGGVLEYSPANLINSGAINVTAGSFKLLNAASTINVSTTTNTGIINIDGGTLDASGSLTIGNATTTTAGVTVNVKSGTMNIAGELNISAPSGAYTGLITIDAGSIVLDGDQTVGIATLVTAGKITVSGVALAAGKTISNTYNAGTGKTTVVAVTPITTWNGTWSNGAPTATVEAIIEGTYATTANGAINAKKLTVNSGSLTINTGTSVTVQNEVVNNAGANGIVVENNANLIQVNSAAVNTGNVVVNRNSSPLLRLDYTLWSSPVANQNLVTFSPLTSQNPNRFYAYDTASNSYTAVANPTTTNFTNGTGYLIRMPNTADAVTPTAYVGQFTGVPNNGDIPFTLSTAGNGYNLVGNPYPSPISMSTLVTDNSTVISTTFYFWRKTNGVGTAYCTYNTAGPLFVTNGNAQSVDPAGIIQTGQGFFVKAIAAGSLVFKNGQRSNNTAGQFFRTKQAATPSRIWLNATNAAGDFSQMAVNYAEAATAGVDDFDSVYINDSALALTSNINGEEYTIQGRPAFDASDVVPLNFKTGVAGDYTIAIDHVDGLFANGQDVYLVDSATGTETNLKTDAYTFTATTGTANSRFSLKYQKTLKVDATTFNENNVVVYKNNGTLYVNSGAIAIDNIKVFDIQGRLVAEQKNVNANTATIKNVKAGQQALIVKVTSQENTVVNKKVMN